MADDLLQELLRSPLDDVPPRRFDPRLMIGLPVALLVVLGLGFLWLRSDPDPVGVPSPGAADAVADSGATDSGSVTDQPPATVVADAALFPGDSVFHEMVALGDGEGTVLLFGGLIPLPDGGTASLEGTWTFSTTTGEWQMTAPDPAPSPRFGHAMAQHPPTGAIVLFGGGTTEPRPCPRTRFCTGPEDNQVWHYDPQAGTWQDVTPPVTDGLAWPAARFGARFAYEPVTERLIMFGGIGVFGERFTPTFYEETWAYDPASNEWEELTGAEGSGPIGRTQFGMVWSEDADRILVFGGDSLAGTDDDRLWAFDPETAVWEDLGAADAGPYERWFHAMTIDPQSGRVVVIGGFGSIFTPIQGGTLRDVGPLDEVWTWSEAEGWVALEPRQPPLSPVTAVGDPATLTIVVYDGHDVLAFDAAVDQWSTLTSRPEPEDEG